MYRRKGVNLPADPTFTADLKELGFEVNVHGQIVSIASPHQFYEYYYSPVEGVNEARKSALHEAIRKLVLSELASLGVKQAFLSGENGTTITEDKPDGPHAVILTSDMALLKEKRDIIVVVNDHVQDLGIWSFRVLEKEGGIDQGSAVGLAKQLDNWPVSQTVITEMNEQGETANAATDAAAQDHQNVRSPPGLRASDTDSAKKPGLIILNPGQLLYSPSLNETMSHISWQVRHRASASLDAFEIDDDYNRVLGHRKPDEHVETVMEHVLPNLVNTEAMLYPVGIRDGAESLLAWLDGKFSANPQDPIGMQIASLTVIESTHSHKLIRSNMLKSFLASMGKAYVLSPLPKGKLIQSPAPTLKSPGAYMKSQTSDTAAGHRLSIRHPSIPIPIDVIKQFSRTKSFEVVPVSATSSSSLNVPGSRDSPSSEELIFPMDGSFVKRKTTKYRAKPRVVVTQPGGEEDKDNSGLFTDFDRDFTKSRASSADDVGGDNGGSKQGSDAGDSADDVSDDSGDAAQESTQDRNASTNEGGNDDGGLAHDANEEDKDFAHEDNKRDTDSAEGVDDERADIYQGTDIADFAKDLKQDNSGSAQLSKEHGEYVPDASKESADSVLGASEDYGGSTQEASTEWAGIGPYEAVESSHPIRISGNLEDIDEEVDEDGIAGLAGPSCGTADDIEAYDYSQDAVSCATFSAGVDVDLAESIWPNVMADVLSAIRRNAEHGRKEMGEDKSGEDKDGGDKGGEDPVEHERDGDDKGGDDDDGDGDGNDGNGKPGDDEHGGDEAEDDKTQASAEDHND